MNNKRKVIIDTDIGVDDAEAILYLLACKNVEVVAITLVSGNAEMPIISRNAKRILTFLNKEDIPIYEMGSYNMLGKYIKTDGYFGKNGFANIELPESSIETKKNLVSPTALIHYARQFPGQVDMLFIGPLTNLALAYLLDNTFPSYIGSVMVLGGDRSEFTIKNVSQYAEFNCYSDPLAYQVVNKCFSEMHSPIILFDWFICWNSLLNTESLFERLFGEDGQNKNKNRYMQLMSIVTDKSNDVIKKNYWDGGLLTVDLFPAIAIDDPSIIVNKKRIKISELALEGEKHGHTVFEDDPNGVFELVTSIDKEKVINNIVGVLSDACETHI